MRFRRALLAVLLALAVTPGGALAASAGDNQYTDPFGAGGSHKHHSHKKRHRKVHHAPSKHRRQRPVKRSTHRRGRR